MRSIEMKRLSLILGVSLALLTACSAPASAPPTTPTPTPTPPPGSTPRPTPTPTLADESKVHLEQGNIYLKQGACDKAITEFNRAIELTNPKYAEFSTLELNPKIVEAIVGRGIANTWAGYFRDADNDFEEVKVYLDLSKIDRSNITRAFTAWGIVQTGLPAGIRRLQQAEDLFDRAIFSDPNNCDAYTGRALMHLKEADEYITGDIGCLSDAISDFEKAIKLDPEGIQGRIKRFSFEGDMAFLPNYIEANKRCGAVLVSTDIYRSKGLEEYDRVLKVAPRDVEALIGRGSAYIRLQQYDLAVHDFDKAIELASDNADAYAGRGIAYTKQNNYDAASRDFEKAIEVDNGYGRGNSYAAYATPETGDETVISFAWSYIRTYDSLGDRHLEQKKYDLAISDFTRAIEFEFHVKDAHHDWGIDTAYVGRGIARARTGAYQQAIDDLTMCEREYLGAAGYTARAIAYCMTGADGKAIDDFYHARGYVGFSMDADAYFARGVAYYRIGGDNYNLADNDFSKVIELAPNSPQATEAQQYRTKMEQSGKLR
ncbi:MAG: tetratricopeptide repeat protein [Chloroflexota bacterium]